MCQIIFRTLIVILNHRWAHLRRRDRKNCADHPIRPAPVSVQTHEIHILIGNATEETQNIFNLKRLLLLTRRNVLFTLFFSKLPLGHNLGNSLTNELRRLPCAATVFSFLAASADVLALAQDLSPACLTASLQNVLVKVLIDKKF